MYECFFFSTCMSMYHVRAVSTEAFWCQILWDQSHRWFLTSMWMLRTDPGSSGRTVCVPNHWAISITHPLAFEEWFHRVQNYRCAFLFISLHILNISLCPLLSFMVPEDKSDTALISVSLQEGYFCTLSSFGIFFFFIDFSATWKMWLLAFVLLDAPNPQVMF